jgi:hypothetical protein
VKSIVIIKADKMAKPGYGPIEPPSGIRMSDAAKRALLGRPSMTLLGGPNGSGKTRLMGWMAESLSAIKKRVLYVDLVRLLRYYRPSAHNASSGEYAYRSIMRKLARAEGGTVVLIDNTGMLGKQKFRSLCKKLDELCDQHMLSKAVVTQTGSRLRQTGGKK